MQCTRIDKEQLLIILITFIFALTATATTALANSASKRYQMDVKAIKNSRTRLQAAINFIDSQPDIFTQVNVKDAKKQLNREQRMIAWQTWQNVLDHILFLDSMGILYGDMYDKAEEKKQKARPFFAAFASFLAQYRYALDFIERMEKNPNMHVLLNESVPELGIEEGTYSELKFRFLNVLRGAEFTRLNVLYLYYQSADINPFQDGIEEDMQVIWQAGKGEGPELTVQNALKVVGDLGFTAWFPVQKGVSELMGNVKVWRPDVTLISSAQIEELATQLKPGDILLERREWFASNIGIPGFWTHAALYIGTPEQRQKYFNDPATMQWLKQQGSTDGTFDNLLQLKIPDQYSISIHPAEDNHMPVILEAIGEGVSFTSIEHSAAADSLAVLRPNLPRQFIARALLRAFHYSGRPYDFNFDFRTDSELVCSELVYKAYEPGDDSTGLNLPLSDVMGRPLISPNQIARLFDEEYDSKKQQFTLVLFLDGNEKEQLATKSTVEEFRQSWQRPKWHIWIQEAKRNDANK